MIWFLGCEHYHHRRIIEYTNRPFRSVEEMNSEMIRRFRLQVRDNDLTYHLGDFGFGPVRDLASTLSELPGGHVLVRGNHDRGPNAMRQAGFAAVVESAVVSLMGRKIYLSHRPLDFLPEEVDGVFHAHVHRGKPDDLFEADETPYLQPFNVNLSVEVIDFRPVSFRVALKRLDHQKKRIGEI